MKIVSFNVNGLRPRAREFGGLKKLLDALDADIICLQETKLSRSDLSADVAIADGYESFFAFPRGKHSRGGWSGVATFCRTGGSLSSHSPVLPQAAEEGFTGVLHLRGVGTLPEGSIGHYETVWAAEGATRARLEELDQEGRVVVTDHVSFVLFNIYGPCVQPGDDDRIAFKLDFYRTLQRRWEGLMAAGRRLVVAGDLNIAPAIMDRAGEEGTISEGSPSRRWLQFLLRANGGPLVDTFRLKHPARRDAYTCFSTASGAATFNFGSRIDLVLVAGPCQHASQQRRRKISEGTRVEEPAAAWVSRDSWDTEPGRMGVNAEEMAPCTSGQGDASLGGGPAGAEGSSARARCLEAGSQSDGGTQTGGERSGAEGLSGLHQAHLFEEFREAVWRRNERASGAARALGGPGLRVVEVDSSRQSSSPSLDDARELIDDQQQSKDPKPAVGRTQEQPSNEAAPSSVEGQSQGADCSCSGRLEFGECEVLDADILSVFPGTSDHRPVFVCLRPQPGGPLHKVPPLSTRNMPELRGKQTRILGYFANGAKEVVAPSEPAAAAATLAGLGEAGTSTTGSVQPRNLLANPGLTNQDLNHRRSVPPDRIGLDVGKKRKGRDVSRPAKQKSLRELFGVPGPSRMMQSRAADAPSKGGFAAGTSCTGFTGTAVAEAGTDAGGSRDAVEEVSPADTPRSGGGARGGASDAAAGWAALRQRMAARHPVCRHGEPAVARLVKKAGPTMGRTFYCCARATGPSSNPEARCDYFEWAVSNTARSALRSPGNR